MNESQTVDKLWAMKEFYCGFEIIVDWEIESWNLVNLNLFETIYPIESPTHKV